MFNMGNIVTENLTFNFCVVNPVEDVLIEWLNATCRERFQLQPDERTLSVIWAQIVGSLSIGAILGALLVRPLSENCGRKGALLLNGVSNIIAAEIVYLAKPTGLPELLVIGRLLLGVNIGVTSGIVPLYIQEITPTNHRGAAEALHLIAKSFSNVLSLFIGLPELLGNEEDWPLAFALPGFFAFLICLLLPFCPESPKYLLVNKEDPKSARKALDELFGKQKASIEYLKLVDESQEKINQAKHGFFQDIFHQKSLRFPFLMATLVISTGHLSGLSAVMSYSTNMFTNARLESGMAKYGTLSIGIVYFLGSCLSPFVIDRFGRRPFYLFQRFASLLALILFTIFTAVQQYAHQIWAAYGTIVALVLYMCLFGIGSPLPWVINLELFSQQYRSVGMSLSVFVVYGLSFLMISLYPPFQDLVGVTLSYVPFILLGLISCVLLYLYLPETRKTESDVRPLVNTVARRSISEEI